MRPLQIVLRVLLPVAVLALGLFAQWLLHSMRPEVESVSSEIPPPWVEVLPARRADVRLWVEAYGTVVPRTETRLVAEVSGQVLEVAPTMVNGGFFEPDGLLVRLDPTDYRHAVAEGERQLARARLSLAQEEADAEMARRDWESLGEQEATALVLRQPQVAEARASLAAAQAAVDKAQRDVERCTIRAPYAGRVREEHLDLGQFINRGEMLAMIYAVDWAEVRLPLVDSDLAHLDIPLTYRGETAPTRGEAAPTNGPEVRLRTRFAGAEHEWGGHIVRTEGELDPRNRMVMAVARVEDPYGHGELLDRPPLTVGMFVSARIRGRLAPGVYRVPRAALRGASRVFIVDGEDRLRMREVRVLKGDRDGVLLSHGLEPGARVVTTPLEVVVDGMRVRVAPTEGE